MAGGGAEIVDEFIGDDPVTPLAPRIAVRAAQHELPAGLVASIDTRLRAYGATDRLDEVLDELVVIRGESGSPPLAAPIGQILASQAIVHVLSATRYQTVVDELRDLLQGRFGTPPGEIDSTVQRAVTLVAGDAETDDEPIVLDDVRDEAKGLAASEEELLLLALFGEEAEPLLRAIRDRSSGEESLLGGGVDQTRAERIREVVRIVQETGIAEIAVEEEGTRVSVRRTEEPATVEAPPSAPAPSCPGSSGRARCRKRRPATARSGSRRRWSEPSTGRRNPARRPSSRKATRSRPARRSASSRR